MSDCTHHWIIAAAEGKQSDGECRNCGAVKAFDNSAGEIANYHRRPRGLNEKWQSQWSADHHAAMRQAGMMQGGGVWPSTPTGRGV